MTGAASPAGPGRSAPISPPAGPLTDGIVCLRRRRAPDLDAISAASHDPEARRWLDDPPMDGPVDDAARTASLDRVAAAFASGRSAPLVIADAATDQPAGLINLQFRDDRVATVAYSVFPAYRGRGVAPRALRLLAEWAFGALAVGELRLEIDPGNAASLRVAAKCGFEPAAPEPGGRADGKRVFARRAGEPPG
jgi:RimJ/RimL family protein N-acetyltransferase